MSNRHCLSVNIIRILFGILSKNEYDISPDILLFMGCPHITRIHLKDLAGLIARSVLTNYILCPWIAKSLWREIILQNCPFCCEAMWLESIIAGVSPLFTNFTRQDKNLHSKQRSKRTRARHERAIIFWFICSADLWESNHNHWNILVWKNSWYIRVKMVNWNNFLRKFVVSISFWSTY